MIRQSCCIRVFKEFSAHQSKHLRYIDTTRSLQGTIAPVKYRKGVRHCCSMQRENTHVSATDVAAMIPSLTPDKYKGQSGKIAVVGGCQEYTGAPFFAAFSALKLGADLSHVFCAQGAATVIKGYSPELIVHPYLKERSDIDADSRSSEEIKAQILDKVGAWASKFGCFVVGPGLGRDEFIMACVKEMMLLFRSLDVPLVIDADGLWIVNQDPSIVKGCTRVVLTPNVVEFQRLANALGLDSKDPHCAENMSKVLQGPIIVRKGREDVIIGSNADMVGICQEEGSPRRAGGQGDVLAGSIATFIAWNTSTEKRDTNISKILFDACGSACFIVRRAACRAFAHQGRAMGATDLMHQLGPLADDLKKEC